MISYAQNSNANSYHLVYEDRSETQCSVSVVQVVIDRPTETASLYLTSQKPLDSRLCLRSEIISNEEEINPAAD